MALDEYLSLDALSRPFLAIICILVIVQFQFRFQRCRQHLAAWAQSTTTAKLFDTASKIHSQLSFLEFPFTGRTAMELGFFYTFGIQGIARVLAKSGQFAPSLVRKVSFLSPRFEACSRRYTGASKMPPYTRVFAAIQRH